MPFEVLHFSLVFLGRRQAGKGSQVPAFSGLWIHFSRIQTILSGGQLSDHVFSSKMSLFCSSFPSNFKATGMPFNRVNRPARHEPADQA